ncbi:PLP-dependent cysteine synthase family protein [Burkholderia sp. Ac-20379]|uniref:PLP-dependent cysteine synthase family protein n=1 Tax=Burkholderia sp. Ac-20379 TaxID=2703900 RepID=UPI0019826045|nr:cysteine synthase family protein [Burkholderia sp. Ac-20379]MBN3723234.1 cysteine synthase family protein [Burkholderia sp. Ac-20379]
MYANSLVELIGDTPLLYLKSLSDERRRIRVYGKLECYNPGNSVKDRSALQLLRQAELDHGLRPGWTVVESTSGNMGHALAMLCATHGYRFICVLDPKTPKTNANLVRAFGGQVEMVEQPDETGSFQKKRIAVARAIAASRPNCINLDQYNNPAAIDAHYYSTGPEIVAQLAHRVDTVIVSASTGSHLSGIARYVKERNRATRVIGVEPEGSVVFGGTYRPHLQNGAGLSFRPGNIQMQFVDETVRVTDRDAFLGCRRLALDEGLLLGGSSGAIAQAARRHLAHIDGPANIVLILPDSGTKYLDTIYDDQWLVSHGMQDVIHAASQAAPHPATADHHPTLEAV